MDLHQTYSLIDRPILPELQAVDNLFIRQLAHLSLQSAKNLQMVSFIIKDKANNRGEIAQRGVAASEKSIIDLCKLTPLVGEFGSRTLLEEIATYRAQSLRFRNLTPSYIKENAEMLMVDYLLSSCLCYVEIFNSTSQVDKFFATRNRFVAGSLVGLEPEETQKYTPYLQSLEASYAARQLKCLKLSQLKDGKFKITQPKSAVDFNRSIKITPVFLISTFVQGISEILQNHMVKFTYIKDNLTEREQVHTLSVPILSAYYDQDFVTKAITGVSTKLGRGYIKLPELGLSKFDYSGLRSLNVTRITSMKQVDSFDTSYINVDFDSILPVFKSTIENTRNLAVLKVVYEDLTSSPAPTSDIFELQNLITAFADSQYAIGTTTALRYLHRYMVARPAVFPNYNGGQPLMYTPINNFNLGGE